MALTIDELQVLITAKTDGLEKAINQTNLKIDALTKKGSVSGSTLSKAFKAIKTSAAIAAITKLTTSCVRLGMEAQETVGMFQSVFGESADEMQEWINKVNSVLGVSIVQLQRQTSYIYSMANSMGLGERNARTLAKAITGLSEDLSHFYNVSSEEAYSKLQSALTGNTRGLKEWGIILDDATIKQVAYSRGIAQTGAELNEQQKVLARYEAILLQTTAAQGSAVREMGGLTSQVTMLRNNFAQLGTTIGSALVGPLAKALSYVNAFIRAVNIVLSELFGVKNVAKSVGGGISSSIGGGLDDATDSAKKLKKQLAGFDELNVLSEQDSGGGALGGLGGIGGYAATEYDLGLDDSINEKAEQIAEKIRGIIAVVSELYNTWIKPVVDFVVQHSTVILSIMAGIGAAILTWKAYFAALNLIPVITGVFESVQGLWALIAANPIAAIAALIVGIITTMVTLYKTNENFRNFVNDMWNKIVTWISDANSKIEEILNNFDGAVKNLVSNVKEKVSNMKTAVSDFVSNVRTKLTEIKSKDSDIILNIKSTVSSMFSDLKSGVSSFFSSIKETVSSKVKSIINSYVISPINRMIGWLNEKLHFSFGGLKVLGQSVIPSFDVQLAHLNTIPQLAKGGIVDSATLAMLGENGKEAVVPLENNTEWMDKLGSMGDTDEIESLLRELISVVRNKPSGITKREIGQTAVDYINSQKRILGGGVV